ncbi:MAG: hypothetical protein R2698_08490 [Microthrixaceae bacterium]
MNRIDRAHPPGRDDVSIVEVAPRDGLQSDPTILSVGDRVELITRAVKAGVRRIETVSFVNPDRVPQMAGADRVMAALHEDEPTRSLGASYIGLVLNERGLRQAIDTGVDEVNAVVVCTDTFGRRNQGRDTETLIEEAAAVVAGARAAGMRTSVTLSAAFGCPFEGRSHRSGWRGYSNGSWPNRPTRSRWPTRSASRCPPTWSSG